MMMAVLLQALLLLALTGLHSYAWVTPSVPHYSHRRLSSQQQHLQDDDIPTADSLPPPLPCDLHNTYYLLRHGQSTANVASIISSSRSLAYTDRHDVTALGYEQGKASAKALLELVNNKQPHAQLVLVSSPFARARSTAAACLEGLLEIGIHNTTLNTHIHLHNGLVERYFGKLDGQAIPTYAYVWPLDRFDVTHTAFGTESVAAVSTRVQQTILDLEEQWEDAHVVLVSHADVLQIAQLYAAGANNVGLFSSYRFQNGEVRQMHVGTTEYLPEPVPLVPPDRSTKTAVE